jgi:hypothetical protein
MGQCDRDECADEQEELRGRLEIAVEKLEEWAAECMECDGTGMVNELKDSAWPHLGYNQVECAECTDIRETIAALKDPAAWPAGLQPL